MKRKLLLDTDVVLRYLLHDHDEMTTASIRLFRSAEMGEFELFLDPIVVAECCNVLRGSIYKFEKERIAHVLTQLILLDGVVTEDPMRITEALSIYAEKNVDFTDAYLAMGHRDLYAGIASFDQDFQRLGVAVHVPT
ncbi:PIN domain-containing protein [Alicyclobacillus fastidiosus]|uniref:PIN domain-containing protein n=1 Tax=Alicyclobacillus fastidiosus TaxID=392011 RepID=UPI0023E958F4|nr:PIN domain-containing protein [Alicyclobacillus fastidiosus]GMA66070.1 hypothetical protein GCM10025859_65120 [Alicyclobacillus fastidiosus]